MGRHFWVGCGCFSWGDGGGRGAPGCVLLRSFHRTSGLQTGLFVLYIICKRGFLDPRTPWADACDVSSFDNPSTCSHSDDSGGVAAFVPPRLHGAVGMIFYAHAVYVVICFMSIICYMPVICLVQSLPQESVVVFGYIEGPFLVSRTGCARERMHHV
jgi:hypothetical protein